MQNIRKTLSFDWELQLLLQRCKQKWWCTCWHISGNTEKTQTQIRGILEGSDEGVNKLIKLFASLYVLEHRENQDVMEFISEFNYCLQKANKADCIFSDVILGFKQLTDFNLMDIKSNLAQLRRRSRLVNTSEHEAPVSAVFTLNSALHCRVRCNNYRKNFWRKKKEKKWISEHT